MSAAADRLAGEGVVETVSGQGLGPPGAADGDRLVMDPLLDVDVDVDVAALGERLLGQLDVGQGRRGHPPQFSLTGGLPIAGDSIAAGLRCSSAGTRDR